MSLDLEPIKERLGKVYVTGSKWHADTGTTTVEVDLFQALNDERSLVAEVEQLRADLRIANEATLVLLADVAAAKAEVERVRRVG